jgi:hypothetical protein
MQKLTAAALLAAVVLAEGMYAGPLGRSVSRAVSRRAMRARILEMDAMRHQVPAEPLPQARVVHRYTTMSRAKQEMKQGLAPDSHMTAVAPPGRPLSPEAAKERYGLLRKPTARETIELPEGFPVRHSHATNAAPGVRELTSPQRVPPEAIKKVVPLKK